MLLSINLFLVVNIDLFLYLFKENIRNGDLVYILRNDDLIATEDHFMFTVEDTKPNKIFNNVFLINWARVHFNSSLYLIPEASGLLELPVIRTGNKKLVLLCFNFFLCVSFTKLVFSTWILNFLNCLSRILWLLVKSITFIQKIELFQLLMR